MNEKNIAAHMAAGDSLEIRLAELALSKATSQSVRDYANMLLTGHRAHLAKVMEIITDEDVGATPLANDPEGMRMRQMLSQLQTMGAGAGWDAAFVRFQVQHHQNELDLPTPNVKNVHDDDFEDLVEKTLASLAAHRDQGKTVASGLGIGL
jgi:putative membrane protein